MLPKNINPGDLVVIEDGTICLARRNDSYNVILIRLSYTKHESWSEFGGNNFKNERYFSIARLTWVCWSMISETITLYGFVVCRHGKSRLCPL